MMFMKTYTHMCVYDYYTYAYVCLGLHFVKAQVSYNLYTSCDRACFHKCTCKQVYLNIFDRTKSHMSYYYISCKHKSKPVYLYVLLYKVMCTCHIMICTITYQKHLF